MQAIETATIMASGQVLVWCADVRERMAEDLARESMDPTELGIPMQECAGPTLAEYKAIIGIERQVA